jgi:hypothetical protein
MENKFRMVETEEYTLAVSDEDASNSYIYFTGDPTGIFKTGIKYKSGNGDYFYQDAITGMSGTYLTTISKKIIGYQPKGNAPELDLPLLPEIVVEDDVGKKENRKICKCRRAYENPLSEICSLCWNELYPDEKDEVKENDLIDSKSATKIYSEDDLRSIAKELASECLCIDGEISSSAQAFKWIEKKIQSLKQPKWFVAEIECGEVMQCDCSDNESCLDIRFKTTTINNKIYLEGIYLFE